MQWQEKCICLSPKRQDQTTAVRVVSSEARAQPIHWYVTECLVRTLVWLYCRHIYVENTMLQVTLASYLLLISFHIYVLYIICGYCWSFA